MDENDDRRQYQRLPLKLPVACQKVGLSAGKLYVGHTLNVSSGGMLLEVNDNAIDHGELIGVEMSVPPTEGLLQYGGRFSSYARVVRIGQERVRNSVGFAPPTRTIALEFCESPKLNV